MSDLPRTHDHDDPQRDAHLREALRHAPDAGVQPPAALSALILQEARAKARDPQPLDASPTSMAPGPIAALWRWLARPAVGTALAGVMAATLVGLMWWDQPMDPAMPRSPAPADATVAAAPVGLTMTPADTLPAPPPAVEAERLRAEAPAPRDTARRVAPPAAQAAEAAKARRDEARAKRAPQGHAADSAGAAAGLREAAPPPPAPVQAPSPVPSHATPGAAAEPSADVERAADTVSRTAAPRQALGASAERAALRQSFADSKAELNETRARREADAFIAIASLRAEVATDPSRWRWQRGAGEPQAMNDAVAGWLAQLDAATARRWQPRAAIAQSTQAAGARELRLLRDGGPRHVMTIGEREITWQQGTTRWHAELSPEQAANLRATLDTAAP